MTKTINKNDLRTCSRNSQKCCAKCPNNVKKELRDFYDFAHGTNLFANCGCFGEDNESLCFPSIIYVDWETVKKVLEGKPLNDNK